MRSGFKSVMVSLFAVTIFPDEPVCETVHRLCIGTHAMRFLPKKAKVIYCCQQFSGKGRKTAFESCLSACETLFFIIRKEQSDNLVVTEYTALSSLCFNKAVVDGGGGLLRFPFERFPIAILFV